VRSNFPRSGDGSGSAGERGSALRWLWNVLFLSSIAEHDSLVWVELVVFFARCEYHGVQI